MDVPPFTDFVGRRVRISYDDGDVHTLTGVLTGIQPAGVRREPYLVMDTPGGIAGVPCSIVYSITSAVAPDGVR